MEPLSSRVDHLPDSELIEAAEYYFAGTIEADSLDELEELLVHECEALGGDCDELLAIRERLIRERDSYRDLLLLLLGHASHGDAAERKRLEAAIAGVGQKQVVTEVFLAGTLALLALLQLTRKKTRIRVVEKRPDGTTIRIEIDEETGYTKPATALGGLLTWLRALLPAGSAGETQDGIDGGRR